MPEPNIDELLKALPELLKALAELPERIAEAPRPPATIAQEGLPSYTGFSRASLFRLMARGQFPKALAIPGSCKRYRRADIDKWLAGLKPSRK